MNKKTIGFAVFYIASIALLILYFTVLKDNNSSKNKSSTLGNTEAHNQLINESDSFFNQLKELQKLDERYSALFVQSSVTPAMDSVDTEISAKEYSYNNIVNRFDKKVIATSDNNQHLVNKMQAFFKQTMENRRAIGNLRYALAAGNFDLDSGQQRWLKLNSDLITKTNQIEELQRQLALNQDTSSATQNADVNIAQSLRSSLTNEQKNASLVSANNMLRQNINSQNKELTQYRKTGGKAISTEALNPSRNTSNNRVEDLNAEIQFARVDCNLSRADVKQIISNSRQRKELLSEALSVLNSLSQSDNMGVQNKAMAKIRELHKITETVRD